jgi:hypothetical protein
MQVHIFRGIGRVFGCTEEAMGANLPAQYGPWSVFKTLDLDREGPPAPGLNTKECLDDIEKYGFTSRTDTSVLPKMSKASEANSQG